MTKQNWAYFQKEKGRTKIRKITGEVITATLIAIGMLVVMGWAGQTFPY